MRKKRGFGAHVPAPRSQQLRALRLLVCMLPYLFFALLSDGMHTHDLAALSSELGVSSHAIHTHLASQVSSHTARTDANCLACEWAANSASILPALPAPPSHEVEVVRVLDPKTELWSSRSVATALGRGPPSL